MTGCSGTRDGLGLGDRLEYARAGVASLAPSKRTSTTGGSDRSRTNHS